jgi:hypothetical protein
VNFRGPVYFAVVSRYHGGAYVVFSQELNDELKAVALTGSYASVIGGGPAATVVFSREVAAQALDDPGQDRSTSTAQPSRRIARPDAVLRRSRSSRPRRGRIRRDPQRQRGGRSPLRILEPANRSAPSVVDLSPRPVSGFDTGGGREGARRPLDALTWSANGWTTERCLAAAIGRYGSASGPGRGGRRPSRARCPSSRPTNAHA